MEDSGTAEQLEQPVVDMNDTWTCNPDESKPTPAVEEPYHYPLPSECESPIYKPPPPLSPIPEVPSKQYIAGDLTLPDPGFEPMHEDEEDVLELHYAPDPALEVEVEVDNTWREPDITADAPVDLDAPSSRKGHHGKRCSPSPVQQPKSASKTLLSGGVLLENNSLRSLRVTASPDFSRLLCAR